MMTVGEAQVANMLLDDLIGQVEKQHDTIQEIKKLIEDYQQYLTDQIKENQKYV